MLEGSCFFWEGIMKEEEIIGIVFKHIRVAEGFTIQEIANAINVSKQYISRIEMGQCSMPISTFNKIFDFYELTFHYSHDIKIDELFNKITRYIFEDELDNIIRNIDLMISDDRLRYSYEYPSILLLEYIVDILRNEEYIRNEEVINLFFDSYSDLQKSWLRITEGCVALKKNDFDKTNNCITHSISFAHKYPELIALNYIVKSLLYERENQVYLSIQYIEKASKILMKYCNIQGFLQIEIFLVKQLMVFNQFYLVNHYCKRLIENCHKYAKDGLIKSAYEVYALNNLYAHHYEDAIEISKQGLKFIGMNWLHYTLAWSYYYVGEKNECKKHLNVCMKSESPFFKASCKIIQMKLNNDSLSKDYHLILYETLQITISDHMIKDSIFIKEQICEYYEEKKDYYSALQIQKDVNEIISSIKRI